MLDVPYLQQCGWLMSKSNRIDATETIQAYVNSASDLAESLVVDIKKDQKISLRTVTLLSRFTVAANAMDKMLAEAGLDKRQLN